MNNFEELSKRVQRINNINNINNNSQTQQSQLLFSRNTTSSQNSTIKTYIDDLSIFFDPINGTFNIITFIKLFILFFIIIIVITLFMKPNFIMIKKECKVIITVNENDEEIEEIFEQELKQPKRSIKWAIFYSIFFTILIILILIGLINSIQVGYKLLTL
jgi:hypothetical protein